MHGFGYKNLEMYINKHELLQNCLLVYIHPNTFKPDITHFSIAYYVKCSRYEK